MSSLRVSRVIVTILMSIAGIMFIMPFLWMLSASFKPELDVLAYPIKWIPDTWNAVENYREVWLGALPFSLYYWNTIKVTFLTTIFSLIISAMAAYGFSKITFKGRDILFSRHSCNLYDSESSHIGTAIYYVSLARIV